MWCDMDWASSRIVIRRQRSGLTGRTNRRENRGPAPVGSICRRRAAVSPNSRRPAHSRLTVDRVRADIMPVSRRLGHSNPAITLSTYSHAFARRDAAPLGERLAAFMRREAPGCVSVVSSPADAVPSAEAVVPFLING